MLLEGYIVNFFQKQDFLKLEKILWNLKQMFKFQKNLKTISYNTSVLHKTYIVKTLIVYMS